MHRNFLKRVFFIAFLAVLCGCAQDLSLIKCGLLSGTLDGHYIQGVPVIAQKQDSLCGPVAVDSIITYWGGTASLDLIREKIYSSRARGSFDFDLERYLKDFGLWARIYTRDKGKLFEYIDRDIPVIVMVSQKLFPLETFHYIVVVGYCPSAKYVIVHTGRSKEEYIDFDSFFAKWKRAEYWSLIAAPPEKVTWPLDAEGLRQLAILYEMRQDFKNARLNYAKALLRNPKFAPAYFGLGNVDYCEGKYRDAKKHYLKAIEIDPAYADAYNNLAWLYVDKGWWMRLNKAHAYADKALSLNPKEGFFYLDTKGAIYLRQRAYDKAIATFKKALSHEGNESAAERARCWLHLARAYQKKRDTTNARRALMEALWFDPHLVLDKEQKKILDRK